MKRMIVFLSVLVLLLVVTPAKVQAQYTVVIGDTGWELARQYYDDATTWQRIVDMNPALQKSGRVFEKGGKIILILKPGEQLLGLEKLGVTAPKAVSISELGLEQPAPKIVEVPTPKIPSWVWWVLFGILALIVLAGFVSVFSLINPDREEFERERVLNQDPVSSGPPMVPGGVNEATAPAHLQEMAARIYMEETGRTATSTQMFTILRSTLGRGWGIMGVLYADSRVESRRLNGERVYQAEVRFPDGNIETLYMLQGCGNDLQYGGIHRYRPQDDFRFEADVITEPAPAPIPVVEVAPALAIVPATAEHVEDGVVRIEVRRQTADQPAMIRMSGVDDTADMTCDIRPGAIVVRFIPRTR